MQQLIGMASHARSSNLSFIAFLPFGSYLVYFIFKEIPFQWASLASVLRAFPFTSFFLNLVRNNFLWCLFSLYVYVSITLPIYFNTKNGSTKVNAGRSLHKPIFSQIVKTITVEVFSDYKFSLIIKIPLAIQIVAAGSRLYSIFGLDWLMHSMAGFCIGAISLKAYKIAVSAYGYESLASYFGLDRFKSLRHERKWATLEWTLFCLIVVTTCWELAERAVYMLSLGTVLRVGLESAYNSLVDMAVGILGGVVAWFLFESRSSACLDKS